jgi:hypothetical protein
MSDATGLAQALLGLDGFRVLEVSEGQDKLVITIEPTSLSSRWSDVSASTAPVVIWPAAY